MMAANAAGGRLEDGELADSLTGTATFKGTAIGKYALDNMPLGDTLEAGHFTAAAELVADFDDATDAGTITGTIDEFMAGGTERDWSVSLGMGTIDESGDAATGHITGGSTVWTMGGTKGAATANGWKGDLYHDNKPRNDGTPARVIGDFNAAHGSVAYMVGAFGADNAHADTPSKTE